MQKKGFRNCTAKIYYSKIAKARNFLKIMKIFKIIFFENSIRNSMHKKIPKIRTGCRVSEAKIYLYHSTEIAKARPHSEEWQTDTSVQKQWSMDHFTGID